MAALDERVQAASALTLYPTLYLGSDDDGLAPGTSAVDVDLYPNVLSRAVTLQVIGHPIGFYLRQGGEIVGLIPDANGSSKPDVLMAKRIGPNL